MVRFIRENRKNPNCPVAFEANMLFYGFWWLIFSILTIGIGYVFTAGIYFYIHVRHYRIYKQTKWNDVIIKSVGYLESFLHIFESIDLAGVPFFLYKPIVYMLVGLVGGIVVLIIDYKALKGFINVYGYNWNSTKSNLYN